MKKSLSRSEYIYIASMLFGMFFGAGNLIFPVYMGQVSGSNMWPALIGFIITGVGMPLLGVAALGISRSSGLFELSCHVGRPFAYFFTCALYLTIGPFFAIPRCATTSFTVGIEQIIPQGSDKLSLYLLLFSLGFFAVALLFSLYPGKIMVWVGKILNPAFLIFLGILVAVTLLNPGAAISEVEPAGDYASTPFFEGFIEGYNTVDALASLAFGIVVINVIRGLGVEDADAVASNTIRAGIFSCLLMAVIYFFVTLIGVHSRGVMDSAENGGVALAQIARHYLGAPGLIILAVTVTLACLKTSVGLITSCAETFSELFKCLSYRAWACVFSLVAFGFANFGLNKIISYSLPVLMFLYPLAIVLILLSLFGRLFDYDKRVYRWTVGITFIAAVYDLCASLPSEVVGAMHLQGVVDFICAHLPLASLGLGWICPAILGLIIGLASHFIAKSKAQTA